MSDRDRRGYFDQLSHFDKIKRMSEERSKRYGSPSNDPDGSYDYVPGGNWRDRPEWQARRAAAQPAPKREADRVRTNDGARKPRKAAKPVVAPASTRILPWPWVIAAIAAAFLLGLLT